MYCNNCGKQLADGADVCVSCGKIINHEASGQTARSVRPRLDAERLPGSCFALSVLMLVISAVISILLAIITFFVFSRIYIPDVRMSGVILIFSGFVTAVIMISKSYCVRINIATIIVSLIGMLFILVTSCILFR